MFCFATRKLLFCKIMELLTTQDFDIHNILRVYIHVYLACPAQTGSITRHNKLIKGKALRKHSLREKTAASVLLKLFISSYE